MDYSQIKSDKFRKKIEATNIRKTIDTVMTIQKKNAADKGIQLLAKFPGFSETEDENSMLMSPVIMVDESRII